MVENSTSPNFDAVFARIKAETGIKSVRQLSEIIGRKHPTVSAAKSKDNFSASWAYEIEKKYGLLTRWIMTGEGPKRISDGVEINPLLTNVNDWLNEEKKHKDAEFCTLFRQQMVRAFFDYERWIQKRDESIQEPAEVKKQANGGGWK